MDYFHFSADLGHVIKLDETQDVEEGDCRYLPRELLEDKLEHLDRADIFSLGKKYVDSNEK